MFSTGRQDGTSGKRTCHKSLTNDLNPIPGKYSGKIELTPKNFPLPYTPHAHRHCSTSAHSPTITVMVIIIITK